MDAAYDEATSQVGSCEKDLAAYLKEVREQLGAGKEVTYCSLNKDSHLIEVGEYCWLPLLPAAHMLLL